MSTPKQIAANPCNSEKSTGPRTTRGKARSRLSASKQGLPARLVVLPGEDAEQYQSRLNAWTGHLAPEGPVELYLVQRAVQISWQIDRADRCQLARLGHQGRPDADASHPAETAAGADRLAFDDSDAGERLRDHQLACGRMLIRTLDAFATLRLAFAEARGETTMPRANPARKRAADRSNPVPTNEPAAIEAVATSDEPPDAHSLIEEILAGLQARSSHGEPPSTQGAPIGRDVRAAAHLADATRNGTGPADADASPRVRPTPAPDRAEMRPGQRSAHLPRVADRDASLSGWPGHGEMEERRTNATRLGNGNGPVRRSSQVPEPGPNEPASRRRVGGYEVPLDPWVPFTGADRAPVRLRRRETRDVSGPSIESMPS